MKKVIWLIIISFYTFGNSFGQENNISTNLFAMDAIQLIFPTNNQQIEDDLRISGSIQNEIYETFDEIDILISIEDMGWLISLSNPSFTTNLDVSQLDYGTLEMGVIAEGFVLDPETEALISTVIDADKITLDKTLRFKASGIIFMLLTWIGILSLNTFAFTHIFRKDKR